MSEKKKICMYEDCANFDPDADAYCCNGCAFDAFDAERLTEEEAEYKTITRDGKKVQLEPPFCTICGTHMGEEYYPEEDGGTWRNPNNYKEEKKSKYSDFELVLHPKDKEDGCYCAVILGWHETDDSPGAWCNVGIVVRDGDYIQATKQAIEEAKRAGYWNEEEPICQPK